MYDIWEREAIVDDAASIILHQFFLAVVDRLVKYLQNLEHMFLCWSYLNSSKLYLSSQNYETEKHNLKVYALEFYGILGIIIHFSLKVPCTATAKTTVINRRTTCGNDQKKSRYDTAAKKRPPVVPPAFEPTVLPTHGQLYSLDWRNLLFEMFK